MLRGASRKQGPDRQALSTFRNFSWQQKILKDIARQVDGFGQIYYVFDAFRFISEKGRLQRISSLWKEINKKYSIGLNFCPAKPVTSTSHKARLNGNFQRYRKRPFHSASIHTIRAFKSFLSDPGIPGPISTNSILTDKVNTAIQGNALCVYPHN